MGASLVDRHKVYYKGEGDGFPQVWAVVSLVSPSLLVVSLNTRYDNVDDYEILKLKNVLPLTIYLG